MRFLLVALLLVGCAEHRVSSWPSTLEAAATDLRTRGEATIEVSEGDETSSDRKRRTATVRASDSVEVELDRGQGASKIVELRIDRLLAECPADPTDPDPQCLLARVRGPIVLERSQRASKVVVLSTVGGLVFSGAIACAFACDDPYATASAVTAGAIAVVGIASLAIIYVVANSAPR